MIPRRYVEGHRKAWALVFVGIFQLGYAGTTLLDRADHNPGRAVLYEMIPTHIRTIMWVVAAVGCVVFATLPRRSAIGWGLAMVMPMERLISHFWSGTMFIVPGYPPGMSASGSYVLIWLAFASLIRLMASWPEPEVAAPIRQEPPHAA